MVQNLLFLGGLIILLMNFYSILTTISLNCGIDLISYGLILLSL